MRIIVTLQVESLRLPLACNYILQSFIYRVLSNNSDYSGFIHDSGYRAERKAFKLFTFRGLTGRYSIEGKDILFHGSVSLELRSPDAMFIQTFLAGCRIGQSFSLYGQEVTVSSCRLINAPLLLDGALVATISPITVHTTDGMGHTVYYNPFDAAFYDQVVANAQRKWASFYGNAPFSFSLESVENRTYRRLVTRFKGTYITGWHGNFILHGAPQALDFLYHTGLGARNSQGFGMFEPMVGK